MILQAIRSTVFYLVFFVHTIPLAILLGLMAKLTPDRQAAGWAIVRYWDAANLFFLRWIVGIRTKVAGMENIPPGGCIIASKHQSDWDIFATLPHLDKPAFIAKKELLNIPLFGWAAAWMNAISVDRKKGKDAVASMMEEAKAALARGARVVIFPEGTRRAPLAEPAYRMGIVKMYKNLGVPVVPVALTSGLYWGRNSLILWPGTARARFLEPIMPGLSPEVFLQTLVERIETQTNRMIIEDVHEGLARPISPRLRSRINAVEAQLDAAGVPEARP